MARTRYLVCYDICHPKRLRQVAKTCESFGQRLQYSVFECPLDDLRFERLRAALDEIIKHDDDYLTAYAHNQTLLVKEGEKVARGQKIAELGSTDADRPKLHFEIRRQGRPVDPMQYLPVR